MSLQKKQSIAWGVGGVRLSAGGGQRARDEQWYPTDTSVHHTKI